jgi:hypothetical protein
VCRQLKLGRSSTHLIAKEVKFLNLPEPQPALQQAFGYQSPNAPAMLLEFLRLLKAGKM